MYVFQIRVNKTKIENVAYVTIPNQKQPGDSLRLTVIAIKIEGYGNSTGSSVIHLMLNGEAYKSETLDGEFKFKWSGDWYSEKAIIRYIANSDSITNLTLSYRMECV